VGLIDGQFRQNLEETDMGYYKEVEMIAMAHDMDLLTCPYVFNENDAIEMTKAGADVMWLIWAWQPKVLLEQERH